MKISVILPCFNGAKTIAVQLQALARQNWPGEWEVIFSNNGSTDNTIEIVESFRSQLPYLTVVNAYDSVGSRLPAWHSYNVALKVATGDAFVFCEADDEVGDGWLEAMAEALKKHDFVLARMDYQKLNKPETIGKPGTQVQETKLLQLEGYPHYKWGFGCTFGFRRSVYNTLGDLSHYFYAAFDTEYCFRAQREGLNLYFVNDAVMHYRLRETPKEMFKQRRVWGKEFSQVMRGYGVRSGRLGFPRLILKILRLSLMSCIVWSLSRLGVPIPLTTLINLSNELGWHLGVLNSLTKPLPPLDKVATH
jgi:glycosyltransferase involved in cell wall biosynthesis